MDTAGTGRGQERRRANIPYGGQSAEETGDRDERADQDRKGGAGDGTEGSTDG